MSRPRGQQRQDLLDNAMRVFWEHGYEATSIEDLVRETGVSRAGLYAEHGGKKALFAACMRHYREAVVASAFGRVERPDAGFEQIDAYFADLLGRIDEHGLPALGCLFANAMTEIGAHDAEVAALVRAHNTRLRDGFRHALSNAAPDAEATRVDQLAEFLAISAQGLWSHARSVDSIDPLRRHAETLLRLVRGQIDREMIET